MKYVISVGCEWPQIDVMARVEYVRTNGSTAGCAELDLSSDAALELAEKLIVACRKVAKGKCEYTALLTEEIEKAQNLLDGKK